MHTVISNNKRKVRRIAMTNCHSDLDVLENLLSTHDWFYMYSDDHRVWSKGTDQASDIRRQIDICCGLGLSEEANLLYEQYQQYKT